LGLCNPLFPPQRTSSSSSPSLFLGFAHGDLTLTPTRPHPSSLPPSLPPSLYQGLIIAWGALQSPLSAPAHVVLVLSFALTRVLHTVTYAMGKQPHRAIAFFGGLLSVVGMSVNGLLGALGKK